MTLLGAQRKVRVSPGFTVTASLSSQLPKAAHCQGHPAAKVRDQGLMPDGLESLCPMVWQAQTYCSSVKTFVQFFFFYYTSNFSVRC